LHFVKRCPVSNCLNRTNSYGALQFQPLHEYIATYNTRYTDRTCLKWRQCGSSDYVEQLPVHDGTGFLLQNQSCKPLTRPVNPRVRQYKLVDGETTRDRDNIWVDCTVCNPTNEFMLSDCTGSTDRVCQPLKTCDADLEYVLRKGSSFFDTVCATRTKCTRESVRSMFEKVPAVDSVSSDVNGTDAVCAPYSKCPDGRYMSFEGDDTRDVACSPCPPGTYRNASLFASQDGSSGSIVYCRECPAGMYSNSSGATACKPCTSCSSATSLSTELSCPFAPTERYCVVATKTPCSNTQDAVCTMCPSLSSESGQQQGLSGFFVSDDGICTACKTGYRYNDSEPVEGKRCVPCPEGYYCPSKDAQIPCPGTAILFVGGKYVAVPQTTPRVGAYKVEHCNCSVTGGFQASQYSQSLLGCEACQDGYYAPPGSSICTRCPAGKYASQKHGLRDYYKCPSATSPRIVVSNDNDGSIGADCSGSVTMGATACTLCPFDRPYTWPDSVSTSDSDCKRCPKDYFFDDAKGACVKCATQCVFPGEYETTACTEFEDRTCGRCELDACDAKTEYPLLKVTGEACPGIRRRIHLVCMLNHL